MVSLIATVSSRTRILVPLLLGIAAIAVAIPGLQRCIAIARKNDPAYRRAHGSVVQIVFTSRRTLIRNEVSELFASDDNGSSWRALRGTPHAMTIANGTELWGAYGWPGHHERASASISYSGDSGETWSTVDLKLPDDRGAELYARLSAAFINEPDAAPLLVMSDFHLARPELVADSTKWKTVGRRGAILDATRVRGTVDRAAGLQHGQSIYVATSGSIYFSGDDGDSWSRQEVHPFFGAQIRCRETACYALLNQLGSEWSGLFTTNVGTNDWKLVRTFEVPQLAPILTSDHRHPSVSLFGATKGVSRLRQGRAYRATSPHAREVPWRLVGE
jgi:hypothetical protein